MKIFKREDKNNRLFSSSYGRYKRTKSKLNAYRIIFFTLALLFLALAGLIFYTRMHVYFFFMTLPAAKNFVALLCIFLSLPALYLAAKLNPFQELLHEMRRHAAQRISNYWHASQLDAEITDQLRLCKYLRHQIRQEALDSIEELFKQVQKEEERIAELDTETKAREAFLGELLSMLEEQLEHCILNYKNRLESCAHHTLEEWVSTSRLAAPSAANADKRPHQIPSS